MVGLTGDGGFNMTIGEIETAVRWRANTITVVNSGPAAAPNALVRDPAVAGLSCSTVDCTSAVGGAACPTGAQQSIANLQGNGIPIPTFPGAVSNGASTNTGSTVTLVIGCTVTATGG